MVVLVVGQVVAIGENARLYIPWHPQHAILLEPQKRSLVALVLSANAVVEVDLELRPSCLFIELVNFEAQVLRVLVFLFEVIRRETDEVHLQWHAPPLATLQLRHKLLDIVNDAR